MKTFKCFHLFSFCFIVSGPLTNTLGLYMKLLLLVACCGLTLLGCGSSSPQNNTEEPLPTPPTLTTLVATAANSWVLNDPQANESVITELGVRQWQDPAQRISSYVRFGNAGELELALQANVSSGKSVLDVTVNGTSKRISLSNTSSQQVYVGKFTVNAGYQRIDIQAVSKEGSVFADIDQLAIGGSAVDSTTQFIRDEFYWGRRGPSVHLSYPSPTSSSIDYFYSEVTVPAGQDVIGSYFMANGFGQGYFGMQVNSAAERRVLFSVWSPNSADDPSQIPADERVVLLRKGSNVNTGEFGNEGAGGQSYLIYPWQANTTYRFLLKAVPSADNNTDYTAWFFAPQANQWQLIASFRRPKTSTYVTSMHSFLENFLPDYGNQTRSALYGNGWVHSIDGQWHALRQATFSFDDTARRKSRWDYQGGVSDGKFYLKNGGFFNDYTAEGSSFTRADTTAPAIDLSQLP